MPEDPHLIQTVEDLARAILTLAHDADMPNSFWDSDTRISLARQVLGEDEFTRLRWGTEVSSALPPDDDLSTLPILDLQEFEIATSKVVVVDDMRVFDFPCRYFRTLQEAEQFFAFEFKPIDELWLDHDLGTDDDGNPQTVRPLVNFLEQEAHRKKPLAIGRIVVCTDNPVGRKYIWAALSPLYNVIDIPPNVKWRVLPLEDA